MEFTWLDGHQYTLMDLTEFLEFMCSGLYLISFDDVRLKRRLMKWILINQGNRGAGLRTVALHRLKNLEPFKFYRHL